MTDTPGDYLDHEPQSERGPVGSRDTGADRPSAGPVDRPVGSADAEADPAAQPEAPPDPDTPILRPGG
ncbi:hypothetical protein [Jidongwangia harbinensis]|uniref:hypothetical protein n=1 Tax=Jidongwangia harbinensis TaxID=2878561 RepID=UPI001CDA3288|nr:hypothetical protein [Jidongwangia harbinensis]MCA2217972.1 hypothetical protein [Jidongwangia harbinensis]